MTAPGASLGPWRRSDRELTLVDARVSTADQGTAVVIERVVDPYAGTQGQGHYEAFVVDGDVIGDVVSFDEPEEVHRWHVATGGMADDVLLLVPRDGRTVLRACPASLSVDIAHRLDREQAHPVFRRVELFTHLGAALVLTETTLTLLDLEQGELRSEVILGRDFEQWRAVHLTADEITLKGIDGVRTLPLG